MDRTSRIADDGTWSPVHFYVTSAAKNSDADEEAGK